VKGRKFHLVCAVVRSEVLFAPCARDQNVLFKSLLGLPMFRESDILDALRLDLAREEDYLTLPKKVDAILHIAGLSATPGVTVEEMLACNVTGTRNLIKYAGNAKVVRVVVASTLSGYGDVVDGVITEATPVRNPGVYGARKYLAERLFAAESHGLSRLSDRRGGANVHCGYRENVYFHDGLSVDCNGRCAGEVGFYRVIAFCRTEF
jgi:hypothetical protein